MSLSPTLLAAKRRLSALTDASESLFPRSVPIADFWRLSYALHVCFRRIRADSVSHRDVITIYTDHLCRFHGITVIAFTVLWAVTDRVVQRPTLDAHFRRRAVSVGHIEWHILFAIGGGAIVAPSTSKARHVIPCLRPRL